MRNLTIALLILFSVSASASQPAGTLGATPTVAIGGQTLINPKSTLKTLTAMMSSAITTNKSTARVFGATSGYVVPGGKTYRISAADCNSLSGSEEVTLGYSDNDVGMAGNTSYTNPVYMFSDSSQLGGLILGQTAAISRQQFAFGEGFLVPSGKYVMVRNTGGSITTCFIYGSEE